MERAFRNTSEVLIPGPSVIHLGKLSGFIILNRSATEMGNCRFQNRRLYSVSTAKHRMISNGNLILVLDPLQIT